jgi:hypothetical protein
MLTRDPKNHGSAHGFHTFPPLNGRKSRADLAGASSLPLSWRADGRETDFGRAPERLGLILSCLWREFCPPEDFTLRRHQDVGSLSYRFRDWGLSPQTFVEETPLCVKPPPSHTRRARAVTSGFRPEASFGGVEFRQVRKLVRREEPCPCCINPPKRIADCPEGRGRDTRGGGGVARGF